MVTKYADPELTAIVKTNGFTPLCLYRCQQYERCIQQCERTVHETIDGSVRPTARLYFAYQEFASLMDDDTVSLIGMAVLVNKSVHSNFSKEPLTISSLIMSLYLLTQCQKIIRSRRRDLTPVADSLDWVYKAQVIPANDVLDQLILKLTERLAVMYIIKTINDNRSYCRTDVEVLDIIRQQVIGLTCEMNN